MPTPASSLGRLLGLVVLLGLLVGLVIGYGTLSPAPGLGAYPDGGNLAVDADTYVGEHVQVTGTVVRTDPVVVSDDYSVWAGDHYRTGTFRLTVTGLSRPVTTGQTLQVYGTVRDDHTVHARNSVAVPPSNRLYMYGVSALAGLWVLARLVRGWTFDTGTLTLQRRTAPLDPRTVLDSHSSTEDADA